MRKTQGKKGLTLVELIIAVAFTAIVIAAACSVLYLSGDFFKSGTANAVNQQKAALTESYLQRYASTAFRLSDTDEAGANSVAFTLSDGVLKIEGRTAEGSTTTSIDGIKQIDIEIQNKLLTYRIVSKDGIYSLSGGIVMNNYQSGGVSDLTSDNGKCLYLDLTPPEANP